MGEGVPVSKYLAAQEQALALVLTSVQKEISRLLRYRVGPVDEAVGRNAESAVKQACGHISAFLAGVQRDRENALLTLSVPGSDPACSKHKQMDSLSWHVQCSLMKNAASEGTEWWHQLLHNDAVGNSEDEGKEVVPQAGRAALAMLNQRDKELEQRDSEINSQKTRLKLQGHHFYKELTRLREQLINRPTKTFGSLESECKDGHGQKRHSLTQGSRTNYLQLAEQAERKGLQLDYERYIDESTKEIVDHEREVLATQYEGRLLTKQKELQKLLSEFKILKNQLELFQGDKEKDESIARICEEEVKLAVQRETERMEAEKEQELKLKEAEHEEEIKKLRAQLAESEELRKAMPVGAEGVATEELALQGNEAASASILMGQLNASQSVVSRQREQLQNLKGKLEEAEEKLLDMERREVEHLEALARQENAATGNADKANEAAMKEMQTEITSLKDDIQELQKRGVRELNRRRAAERKVEGLEDKYRLALRDLAAVSRRVSLLKSPQDQSPERHTLGPGPYVPAESHSSVSLSNTGKVFPSSVPKPPSSSHTPRGPGLNSQSQIVKSDAGVADASESMQRQRPSSARVSRPTSANSQRPKAGQRPMSARCASKESVVSHNYTEELVEMLSVAGTGEALQRSAMAYTKGSGSPPAELDPWCPGGSSERVMLERQRKLESQKSKVPGKPLSSADGGNSWQPASARPRPGSAKYIRP